MTDKFAGVPTGTLVCRSEHWYRNHPSDARGQLGVVIGREIYALDAHADGLTTFPIVWWENSPSSSMTHPDNIEVAPSVFKRELDRRAEERSRLEARLSQPPARRRRVPRTRARS